ncbi:ankyrin repeat-containing domain protein [Chaetomium fimeti]|uniref:Ankyrin repeat-containing domain protein n=1 Tax=Chaetomium fimeti TaxID=1854472 RepID=A0AAE0LN23_9PEZI|nr:ankyrin repeat-containing domain protein [Chaetomium fimeti]
MANQTKENSEAKEPPPSSSDTSTTATTIPPSAVTGPVDFAELPGLPRLRYRILEYKLKLSIVVSLLVLESSLLPISLYYGLILGTTLRPGIVFAIITSFFGIVTGIEFGLRCIKLIWMGEKYRPVAGTRWSFDFTHWTLSFGYTVMTAILIGGSVPHPPIVRALAIPVSLFFIQIGLQLVWSGWMNVTRRPAPCKISSIPKGGRVPPLVFTLVEDIVGVDGAGGRVYRSALVARYQTSSRFRTMIAQQNWFWAAGALFDGIGTMAVIWTVPEKVAYGPDHTTMARTANLGSIPPELIYEIVEFLGQRSLSSVSQCSRFFHSFTSHLLYRRDATEHKSTGLVRCIRSGATESVAKFIAAGMDVNATTINISPDMEDFSGNTTVLATAVVRNQIEIVRLLLSHGADVCARIDATLCYSVSAHPWANASPITPLSLTITEGHTDIAVALVDHMANADAIISTVSGVGYTALEQAALCLRPTIVRRLLERGADPDQRTLGGATILHRVMANSDVQRWADGICDGDQLMVSTVMALLTGGANPALRPCPPVQPGNHAEECSLELSVYNLGIKSRYGEIRQHFAELVHRRLCEKSACRAHRYDYGLSGEDIPGHCAVSPDDMTSEELRLAESLS